MDTQITTEDPQNIARNFHDAVVMLDKFLTTLRGMEASPMKASMALEFSQEARRYLDMVDSSELKTQSQRLYQAHRYWTGILKKARMPGEILLKYCQDVRSDWEVERRRLRDQEQQKLEQQANLFAKKARQEEVKHLRLIGKDTEADARATAPIEPITVSVNPDLGKPEGEVMVEVWQPKRDENGEIVFSDLCSYLAWLVGNPPLYHFIKHQYGTIKKWLTDNRGLIQPPGMEIEHKFEPRTRRESDE